ncbi:dihydrolipoamide acetyltransferase family protein [Streptomyces sp. NPDC007369]|uniref:dihydrolipoamide acetyltransferase family protein n=1 Tax=Streptomyces sp. NPDC007369 TaxID=3154589 RepID=UPI0033F3C752
MPDVGEGLTEAEILKWYVQPGDTVTDGQVVCEVETAKAAVELPIPFDGTVHALLFEEGTTVDVGQVIISVQTGDASGAPAEAPAAAAAEAPAAAQAEEAAPEGRQPVLVGYGVAQSSTKRRPRKAVPAAAAAAPAAAPAGAPAPAAAAAPAVPGARETRIPVKGVRKVTAQAMVGSAFTAPHVTEFITFDITKTMKLVQELKADPDLTGLRINPLLLVAKAVLVAVGRNPDVNASWDEAAQEIVLKHYVNLGIAAATPRGLIVPNIKDAHAKTLPELSRALSELVATAREGKTSPADMQGGTLTITNVGVFGVDTGTPILNPGESAILAVGAIKLQPWVHKGKVKPRHVTTLALSFDHRLIDGELGSKFLADVAAVLEDPRRLITWQ